MSVAVTVFLLGLAVRSACYVGLARLLRRSRLGRLFGTGRFLGPYIILYVADVIAGGFGTADGGAPRWGQVAFEYAIACVLAVLADWSLGGAKASDPQNTQ